MSKFNRVLIIFAIVTLSIMVHEIIHIVDKTIVGATIGDICFFGFKEDGFSSKAGWVYSDVSSSEVPAVIGMFVFLIVVTYISARKWDD